MTEIRHALILPYGDARQGCEAAALDVQRRLLGFLTQLERKKAIVQVRAYIHLTGDRMLRSGMIIVEAERQAIQDIFWNTTWKTQTAQARSLLNHVTLELAVGGEPASLAGPASVYEGAVGELDTKAPSSS